MKYLSYKDYLRLINRTIGERRLTLTAISDKTGMDRRFVSAVVNGKSKDSERLMVIGEAVGVAARELFGVPK
jgi:transcriptional regulator with XRE-family HTH domain